MPPGEQAARALCSIVQVPFVHNRCLGCDETHTLVLLRSDQMIATRYMATTHCATRRLGSDCSSLWRNEPKSADAGISAAGCPAL